MGKKVFAIGCHPDDIEYMMAGTLIRLGIAGYEMHYMNLANGSLGTDRHPYEEIIRMRREESLDACNSIGAVCHESIADDLEAFYNFELLSKLVSIVREVSPDILLTHGPYDYMEDHVNTCRLAVTAAFCRGMSNFKSVPPSKPSGKQVAVYHSMPHSLTDQLRIPIIPGILVDIEPVITDKRKMLACHRSQKEWLDVSQGNNAYLNDMENKGLHYGKLSEVFKYAEGWIKHSHVGFCGAEYDPISEVLGTSVKVLSARI